MEIKERKCTNCQVVKPLTEFHKCKTGKYGRRAMCKKCCYQKYNTKERQERRNEQRRIKRKNEIYLQREYAITRRQNRNKPINYLLRTCKYRAKKKGLDFSITAKDLFLPVVCPLLGIKLQVNEGRMGPTSYSIDRLDNTKGYIPGNVWIISNKANQIKNNATIHELELLVSNLRKQIDHWEH